MRIVNRFFLEENYLRERGDADHFFLKRGVQVPHKIQIEKNYGKYDKDLKNGFNYCSIFGQLEMIIWIGILRKPLKQTDINRKGWHNQLVTLNHVHRSV